MRSASTYIFKSPRKLNKIIPPIIPQGKSSEVNQEISPLTPQGKTSEVEQDNSLGELEVPKSTNDSRIA